MDYQVKIDSFDREEWDRCASYFLDNNLYQTWAYQEVRADAENQGLRRIIVMKNAEEPVLMGQVRIKKTGPLGLRIGYVQWGPLVRIPKRDWQEAGEALNLFRRACLENCVNVLRLVPNVCDDENGRKIADVFAACGFERVPRVPPYQTMMFPLLLEEEEMRSKFHRKWRRDLRKAETRNLEVQESSREDLFGIFEQLYAASQERKKFRGLDVEIFIRTQKLLPPEQKMNVVTIFLEGEPLTIDITSYLGDTAVGIFQASSEKGLQYRASYLAWWKTLLAARRAGMTRYDLGGIDPVGNPHVYHFKKRMGAEEVFYVGVFDAYANTLAKKCWNVAEKIYRFVRPHK